MTEAEEKKIRKLLYDEFAASLKAVGLKDAVHYKIDFIIRELNKLFYDTEGIY